MFSGPWSVRIRDWSSQLLNPSDEASIEGCGVQCAENSSKRVSGRNPIGQLEKRLQPALLGLTKLLHVLPTLPNADHSEQCDHKDVHQRMAPSTLHTRVWDFLEETEDRYVSILPGVHGPNETPDPRQWTVRSQSATKGRSHKVGTNLRPRGQTDMSDGAPALPAPPQSCSFARRST